MHIIKDENGNVMPHHNHNHETSSDHTHEHQHTDGETHTHEHSHAGGESHEHSHECSHNCDSCSGHNHKEETVALLTYMLAHNEQHANELDQMASNLEKLDMNDAAKQIKESVSDFQKGNMRLSLALTLVKEALKGE